MQRLQNSRRFTLIRLSSHPSPILQISTNVRIIIVRSRSSTCSSSIIIFSSSSSSSSAVVVIILFYYYSILIIIDKNTNDDSNMIPYLISVCHPARHQWVWESGGAMRRSSVHLCQWPRFLPVLLCGGLRHGSRRLLHRYVKQTLILCIPQCLTTGCPKSSWTPTLSGHWLKVVWRISKTWGGGGLEKK